MITVLHGGVYFFKLSKRSTCTMGSRVRDSIMNMNHIVIGVRNAKPWSHGLGFCPSQALQEAAVPEPLLSKQLASGKPF